MCWNLTQYANYKGLLSVLLKQGCLDTELTFTTLGANSADHKQMIFFLFFPENWIWHFMQIIC